MREIVIATNGDEWEGLYINGVLATEDLKLSAQDILDALCIKYSEKDCRQYFQENSLFPISLSDLDDEG